MAKEVKGLVKNMGKSVFLNTFGDTPFNRVVDFLTVFDKFDYSIADIAERFVQFYWDVTNQKALEIINPISV